MRPNQLLYQMLNLRFSPLRYFLHIHALVYMDFGPKETVELPLMDFTKGTVLAWLLIMLLLLLCPNYQTMQLSLGIPNLLLIN